MTPLDGPLPPDPLVLDPLVLASRLGVVVAEVLVLVTGMIWLDVIVLITVWPALTDTTVVIICWVSLKIGVDVTKAVEMAIVNGVVDVEVTAVDVTDVLVVDRVEVGVLVGVEDGNGCVEVCRDDDGILVEVVIVDGLADEVDDRKEDVVEYPVVDETMVVDPKVELPETSVPNEDAWRFSINRSLSKADAKDKRTTRKTEGRMTLSNRYISTD